MRKLVCSIPALAVIIALSSPAVSQTKYRFEVFGAANFPFDKNFEITVPQSTVPIKGKHEFSAGGRGGVRFGGDLKGHWGQDIIYSYGTNASRIVNQTTGGEFPVNNRIHQLCINALWYPGGYGAKKRVMPFITAGVGAGFYRISQSVINEALDPARGGLGKLRNENVFQFNAGGGIAFRVNSVWGIRIDVRDSMSRPIRYGLPEESSDPAATVFPVNGIFHQLEIAFAFVYYFK
jgi:opacity protein-like surface antigen